VTSRVVLEEPTVLIHVPPHADVLAMDVHKLSISAGVLPASAVSPVVDKIGSDEESVRRLVGRFDDPGRVWACNGASPTGYELARAPFHLARRPFPRDRAGSTGGCYELVMVTG